MKPILITLAIILAFPLSPSLFQVVSSEENEPCQAYTVETNGIGYGFEEINTCPLVTELFSIRGTFSNENWQVYISAWEPAAYIYRGINRRNGNSTQVIDFDIIGTTNRPQYRFSDRDFTYIVIFRYSDSDTIRLEIYQRDRVIVNELLTRTTK